MNRFNPSGASIVFILSLIIAAASIGGWFVADCVRGYRFSLLRLGILALAAGCCLSLAVRLVGLLGDLHKINEITNSWVYAIIGGFFVAFITIAIAAQERPSFLRQKVRLILCWKAAG